jgi:predicted ferric reductase
MSNSKKYHQAALVYAINAIVYFFVATFRMPPHDFGIWNYLFYTLGAVFAVLFPYLIYKEYRIFTAILAVIYLIRAVVSLIAIPSYSVLMIFIFLLTAFTCFMLARAAWNIEIFSPRIFTEKHGN